LFLRLFNCASVGGEKVLITGKHHRRYHNNNNNNNNNNNKGSMGMGEVVPL
jgi:hypothetical protein